MEILKTLAGILAEEQVEAVGAELNKLIDEKATERASKIVEEETEKIRELALKAGQKYYDDKLARMQASYAKIAEEEVDKARAEFASQLVAVERGLVAGVSRVVEESVSKAIPQDVAETIASAKAVISLVEESKAVFERHYVSLDLNGQSKIAEIEGRAKIAEESLDQTIQEREQLRKENMVLKAKSLIDGACVKHGIAEEGRIQLYTMMNGKPLSAIERDLVTAVKVVEESFGGKQAPVVEESKTEGTQPAPEHDAQKTITRATGIVEEGVNKTEPTKSGKTTTEASVTSVDGYF